MTKGNTARAYTVLAACHVDPGSPDAIALRERFDRKVLVSDGCWEWQAGRGWFGYGQFGVTGSTTIGAHRVAWILAHGPIPDGYHVLHRCDTPPCVRIDHLFLGTNADNIADKTRKGRARGGRPRQTHCQRGHDLATHAYTNPNTGERYCRTCVREHKRTRERVSR
jgi:hypothetical protein